MLWILVLQYSKMEVVEFRGEGGKERLLLPATVRRHSFVLQSIAVDVGLSAVRVSATRGLFPVKAMGRWRRGPLSSHWHTGGPAAATYRNCFPAKPADKYASISHWPSWTESRCQIDANLDVSEHRTKHRTVFTSKKVKS